MKRTIKIRQRLEQNLISKFDLYMKNNFFYNEKQQAK